ncbi:MAG: glucan biosynthesis protein [Alphaproteobacteria bacterium]
MAFCPLPRGYIFPDGIDLSLHAGRGSLRLRDASPYYDFVDFAETSAKDRARLGISGWRLLRQTSSVPTQEVAVFQGGAYFRAVAESLFLRTLRPRPVDQHGRRGGISLIHKIRSVRPCAS